MSHIATGDNSADMIETGMSYASEVDDSELSENDAMEITYNGLIGASDLDMQNASETDLVDLIAEAGLFPDSYYLQSVGLEVKETLEHYNLGCCNNEYDFESDTEASKGDPAEISRALTTVKEDSIKDRTGKGIFPLLRLPCELRLLIFECAMPAPDFVLRERLRDYKGVGLGKFYLHRPGVDGHRHLSDLGYLATCEFVLQEAMPLVYKHVYSKKLDFDTWPACARFLDNLRPATLQQVRDITIQHFHVHLDNIGSFFDLQHFCTLLEACSGLRTFTINVELLDVDSLDWPDKLELAAARKTHHLLKMTAARVANPQVRATLLDITEVVDSELILADLHQERLSEE